MFGPVCVLLVHTYWFADSFRAEGHSQRGTFTILSGWQWHEWRKPVRLWRMNSGTCRETRIRLSLLCWHCISGLGCWGTVFVCMCRLWFWEKITSLASNPWSLFLRLLGFHLLFECQLPYCFVCKLALHVPGLSQHCMNPCAYSSFTDVRIFTVHFSAICLVLARVWGRCYLSHKNAYVMTWNMVLG